MQRYTDNVPMTLDQSFVLALEDAFPQALTASLPISEESNSRARSTIAAARRRLGEAERVRVSAYSLGGSSAGTQVDLDCFDGSSLFPH